MFETSHPYPAALAASPRQADLAVATAIKWVLAQRQQVGGTPLIYAPGKKNIGDHQMLSAFAQQPGVEAATWRTVQNLRSWSGPVLAAWPDRTHLAQIADRRGVRALCVVPWADGEVDAWALARRPVLLPGAEAPAGITLDPVVAEGLKTLTSSVNHSNELAGSLDHRDAVAVLKILHGAGHRLDHEAIYSWALAHGWPARGADRLRDMARKTQSGQRLQMKGPSPFRADILERWRTQAERN